MKIDVDVGFFIYYLTVSVNSINCIRDSISNLLCRQNELINICDLWTHFICLKVPTTDWLFFGNEFLFTYGYNAGSNKLKCTLNYNTPLRWLPTSRFLP